MRPSYRKSSELELIAPDISSYRKGVVFSNQNIEYVHQFDSGISGPHIIISAIVHGNEICGAIALDHLLSENVRPIRGKLSLVFANVDAYQTFDPKRPYHSRFIDHDFNRIWDVKTLEGTIINQEIRRAKELRPIIEEADILLDLHSMGDDCPPLLLSGPLEKGLSLAQNLYAPGFIIMDEGHLAGVRLRDYAKFIDPTSSKNALLLECGQHWKKSSAEVAIEVCYRFLHHFDLIEEELCFPYLFPREELQRKLRVTDVITVKNDAFFFTKSVNPMEIMPNKGTLLGHDSKNEIYTPYDNCYLIMPQHGARQGQTAVRLAQEIT